MADDKADGGTSQTGARDPRLQSAFRGAVEEGEMRLGRTLTNLFATGFIAGIEVGLGVLALLVVESQTGSRLLGALAFVIGFVALTLGRSELFTENFLLPVVTVVARGATVPSLLRLWAVTAVANLAGGYIVAALMMAALPRLHDTAIETVQFYTDLGIGWPSFALGMLGGVAITVMTWMQQGSRTEFGRIASAISVAFLLAAVPLNHIIVVSLEMFAALRVGAPFGYADWAATAAWAGLANIVGGTAIVTLLRLIQVGGEEITQQHSADDSDAND